MAWSSAVYFFYSLPHHLLLLYTILLLLRFLMKPLHNAMISPYHRSWVTITIPSCHRHHLHFLNSHPDVTAYPESVNVLEGVKDDVRTPSKLIDGINDTDDGRHMWLAPVFPGLVRLMNQKLNQQNIPRYFYIRDFNSFFQTNLLYVVFDEPITISMIKLWNYRKTPIRGVRQFSVNINNVCCNHFNLTLQNNCQAHQIHP